MAAMGGSGTTGGLVARARRGDEGAWRDLVLRHDGALRLFVRARLGRALALRVEAEDVVQEAWVRAVGSLPGFEPRDPASFGRWLRTLAANALADAARAARAARRDGAREVRLDRGTWGAAAASALADSTAGPASRAARTERHRALEEAFSSLSPAHRRVIRMRQFEGLPAREVAIRIGSGEGAVHALYRRALQAWADAAAARGAAPTA